MVHPEISGNKFYKLKYNLEAARKEGHGQIITFGGAFSNHIAATAAAARALGISSVGIIRGEKTSERNPTLSKAMSQGMRLYFITRDQYRHKNSEIFQKTLEEKFGPSYFIPEGGTNALAIQGTREILSESENHFDNIAVSIGTGGTFLGVADSLKPHQHLLGFSSLKGSFIHEDLAEKMEKYQIQPAGTFKVFEQFHFGGYAKFTPELISFLRHFYDETGIPLDPVYTGKMMFAIVELIKNGIISRGGNVLALHTGGLQGIEGFNTTYGLQLPG
jgi:1-aminocyclopropane-1-carboxylate deaminase